MSEIRWTPQRKWSVIKAVRQRPEHKETILTESEITAEEFATWERDLAIAGIRGLRVRALFTNHPQRRRIL